MATHMVAGFFEEESLRGTHSEGSPIVLSEMERETCSW